MIYLTSDHVKVNGQMAIFEADPRLLPSDYWDRARAVLTDRFNDAVFRAKSLDLAIPLIDPNDSERKRLTKSEAMAAARRAMEIFELLEAFAT